MLKHLARFFYFLFGLASLLYLALPSPSFPLPPADSVQSFEPGDSEATDERRAYFTNYTRQEVLEHYQKQLSFLPTYRLNYPPEESQILIRDQTRSTFLEEIVHPLRESVYVNGFEPKDPKDDVWYKGIDYRQKITIRYVTSSSIVRFGVWTLIMTSIWLAAKFWGRLLHG